MPSEAVYSLPIPEDGIHRIYLLHQPGSDRAGNVPVAIRHADGIALVKWDMRRGSKHGFAMPIGEYPFKKGGNIPSGFAPRVLPAWLWRTESAS